MLSARRKSIEEEETGWSNETQAVYLNVVCANMKRKALSTWLAADYDDLQ